ncbi:DUF4282 domain-containing protein [Acaryochloris sp. CCMEE 5410]|uniref:DUF4282 domain-containing protein n=1 Tax=Acaryochloris sp. CCMEE 5410 TaxID=310037 RepID=UPI0002483F29|nr:DUF4282 domain-containing protein [Acaryochloris sp. CCMEE 5410]KAI9130668.1 DUF4282 domain-containing protein [Acaryochloris sp. CCMEE 5410]
MASRKGFFAKLFDLSFSEFIAIQIAGVLYGIGILFIGLTALGILFAGLSQGALPAIGALIIAPLAFVLYVIFFRIVLESFIASIRTAENTSRIANSINR